MASFASQSGVPSAFFEACAQNVESLHSEKEQTYYLYIEKKLVFGVVLKREVGCMV